MLELEQLLKLHDKAHLSGQTGRDMASDDLLFARVTQWDDNLLEDTNLAFRGQFDILKKAHRQIMGDLAANPVQVDFKPKDDSRTDGADLLDGLYRQDDRRNDSIEAYNCAAADAVDGGFGAWELYTKYASNRVGDLNQVIRRRYIPEAINTVFFDPNAKRLDKSDARYVSVLTAYSEDGYKELYKELTGDEYEGDIGSNFKSPEHSYTFPWAGGGEGKKIYVTRFYHKAKVKDTVLTMVDPMGIETVVHESRLDGMMDDLIDAGFEIINEKTIERWEVTLYVASGEDILETAVIPGEHLPVIPMYGERYIVEGEEYYQGITRLAKDPQRLRNFQMSYLADIVSKSPRAKPIFNAEQIQGFEDMYDVAGTDNDYPYLLQNRLAADGTPLPLGPVAQMPDSPIPQALAASIELTRQAVEDVANPGLPQDIADPDLSGKAVIALQNRMDQQSYIFQANMKHAKRRDGEVYASMAQEVYDAPRTATISLPDGSTAQVEVMRNIIDAETGEIRTINDLTSVEFDVYSDIGPSYSSMKEQTIDRYAEMAVAMAQTDPVMSKALQLKVLELMDGTSNEDIREYARKQLLLSGFKEPQSQEDLDFIEQSQRSQQPDANMLLAQAENKKGDAALMEAQRKAFETQAKVQNDMAKTQIDGFEAETGRMSVQVDAAKANAEINLKRIDQFSKQVKEAANQFSARGMIERSA